MTKPRSFAPIIAALLLLLPVLYVGSYLALVKPRHPNWTSSQFQLTRYPYRFGGGSVATLFWPLEQIDRKFRPKVWEADRDAVRRRAGMRW